MRVVTSSWIGWIVALATCGCSSEPSAEPIATLSSGLNLATAEVGAAFETDAAVPTLGRLGHDAGVAFDGETYAAVFEDQTRVHAVRISAEGRVLDMDWLDFELEGMQQLYPSLAFGGGKYLATWSELGEPWLRIRGQLFAPDGTLSGEPFTIAGDDTIYSSVTFDGSDFLVGYQVVGGESGVAFSRVSPSGVVVDGSEQAPAASSAATGAVVAAGDNVALMVWLERGDTTSSVRATRIAASTGLPLDAPPLTIAGPSADLDELAVAGAGEQFLIAYRQGTRVLGQLLDAGGAVSALTLSPADSEAGLPAVAASGAGFVVAWADSRDEQSIRGVRVSSSGQVLDTPDKLLASGKPRYVSFSEPLSLTSGDEQLLLGFIGDGVQGSVVSAELELEVGDFPISAVPNPQGAHQVAWNGESYVITWVDERNGRDLEDMDGRAVRIGPDGTRLEPDGVVVAAPGTFSMTQAVGENGDWLAAWHSVTEQKLYVRAATGGALGEPHELTSRQVSSSPGLAYADELFMSAYTEFVSSSSSYSVFARSIAGDGTPGTEFPLESGLSQPPSVSLFGHDGGYVLSSSLDRVTLRTLTNGGELGEPLLLQEGDAFVAAASNGEELLIASIDQATARVSARFFADGELRGDEIPIAETSSGFSPAVAWDGEAFVVVWDEAESRVAKARSVAPNGSLSAVRTLVDAECFGPWLASNGAGQLLLSCVSYRDPAYVRRIDSYFVGTGSTPSVPLPGGGGRPGMGGAPSSEAGSGGEPVVAPGSGGRAEPSASGGTADAGEPGLDAAGEGGIERGGSGGRSSGETGGRAGSAGAQSMGGTSEPPPDDDDDDDDDQSGDDGGCSVGAKRPGSSSAWVAGILLLALGGRRRRS